MFRRLTILLGCSTAVLGLVLVWLIAPHFIQEKETGRADEDIIFPMKTFVAVKAYVAAKGTLKGDWLGYKNNTYSILCVPEECIVASVEQIGPRQMSDIDGPVVYPIKRWTDEAEVIAEDDTVCTRITITLDRRTETVLWVETPINQTEIACKNADNNIRKATLEASLYWQRSKIK